MVNKGIQAVNDFTACVVLLNKEIKKKYPTERQEWTTEQYKLVISELDDFLQVLTKRYQGILNGKKR